MALTESKAEQVLNTYLNFCEALQREGKITDENFNRIRFINGCINGQQDENREIWGDLFDEIYYLLQKPEIKLRFEKEQKENQLIRQKRILKKQKLSSNLKSKNSSQNKKCSNNLTTGSKKVEPSKKNRVEQRSGSNKNSKSKNSKQAKKLQLKRKNKKNEAPKKTIEQIREIRWKLLTLANQEYEPRKKSRIQYVQPLGEVSSTFKDVMDERRAEGKGYGGSK